jgi:hypothetical protein
MNRMMPSIPMTTPTTTIAALGAEISLPSVWLAWMLCIFALNGAAALACVALVLNKNTNNNTMADFDKPTSTPTTATAAAPHMARQNANVHEVEPTYSSCRVGAKRKSRDHQPEFPFARKLQSELPEEEPITQGRTKLRRVTKITIVRFGARRSRSFGDEMPTTSQPPMAPSPLRRVVSCGDSAARPFEFTSPVVPPPTATAIVCAPLEEAAANMTALLREIRLRDVLSSAKAVVFAKLREAARNAVDEVLTSIISFLTYGMLLFFLRQYSAVAVGVSLDLGAFSIEL